MTITASKLTTGDLENMDAREIISLADPVVKSAQSKFIQEFNRREYEVRIAKKYDSFENYAAHGYIHDPDFGYGFVVDGRPVPYFHPNRSFHDEIIWLNDGLYYDPTVSFEDKLINSAVVKFYGPSKTLDIITGKAEDVPDLRDTGYPYINFGLLNTDQDYEHMVMSNIEIAFNQKKQIWGTTELRTSLQTASRNYARENPSIIDRMGAIDAHGAQVVRPSHSADRKMRPSDMIHWIRSLSLDTLDRPGWVSFYRDKPDMESSFVFLTQNRGIGNYYGYHFSSNLARMPGVGSSELIEAEHCDRFMRLKEVDPNLTHGNLDENADYVVPGPGATRTLERLFPTVPINQKTMSRMILAIRDNQEEFFGIKGHSDLEMHLREASELGRFTTFGIEISCCQFDVFSRAIDDYGVASQRAAAPISKLATSGPSCQLQLSNFYIF